MSGRGGARPGAGRRYGGLSEAKRELMAMAQDAAPDAMKTLKRIANDAKAPPAAQVAAATAILDRAYGKPPQLNTDNTEAFKKAIDMSDDELASIAAGGSEVPPAAPFDPNEIN